MTSISPVSFSVQQNDTNNSLKNSQLRYNNSVSFKGLGNVTANKAVTGTLNKNKGKILTGLAVMGATILGAMGLKTPKEKKLIKNFEALLDKNELSYVKQHAKIYQDLLKIYTENPELFEELASEKLCFEFKNLEYDTVNGRMQMYGCESMVAIHEINKIDPSLKDLAKKALGGRYDRLPNYPSTLEKEEIVKKITKAILERPDKVREILENFEKTKMFNNYSLKEQHDYYALTDLLKALLTALDKE